jgi:hypothetical protein
MRGDHGAAGVKIGCVQGVVGAENAISLSRVLPPARLLALWGSRRYISLEFPDKMSAGVALRALI